MFFTGGSDYHGMNSRIPIEVGDYVATRQAVEIIFGRVIFFVCPYCFQDVILLTRQK